VTLFTVAEDLARLRLWVYVDEADVGAVKVGQGASFTVSAYPNRHFPASITRVGFGSTITDNVVTYLTYLDVSNSDLSLRPGMTATAAIVATERKNVLLVPNAALRYKPTEAAIAGKKGIASGIAFGPPKTESKRAAAGDKSSTANARQVWVLPSASAGHNSVPIEVAVIPGISDGRMTEIVSGDLKEGMLVITAQKLGNSK
jgi:HlyD family secretion protein